VRLVLSALIDPSEAMRRGATWPRPWRTAAALASAVAVLGLATLPRQVAILNRVLAPTGDPQSDLHHELLRSGLLRVIVVDRLIPAPALLLAAVLLVAVAEPVLMLAGDRRTAIAQVALLGLAPLLVDRLGELAMTYLLPLADQVTAGDAVLVPHRFRTGPLLLWRSPEPAPAWLELLEPRANLIVLWAVALWSMGLRRLAGRTLETWHVALPLACVLGAGVVTWILGPLIVPAILGGA
jgi:hypothetical protein